MLPGVGVFGTSLTARVIIPLLKDEGFAVKALWGRTQEEAEELAKAMNVPFYTSRIDEVLLHQDVDLVCINLPPPLTRQIAVKTLVRGLPHTRPSLSSLHLDRLTPVCSAETGGAWVPGMRIGRQWVAPGEKEQSPAVCVAPRPTSSEKRRVQVPSVETAWVWEGKEEQTPIGDLEPKGRPIQFLLPDPSICQGLLGALSATPSLWEPDLRDDVLGDPGLSALCEMLRNPSCSVREQW
ncbi:Glucose-fructose oxidoreductase domain-containing protein 1 [Heterocephalus glaber]|uniref:Glucose-fructose oxidoreductase domain-containing protein 1 n=1 Tax=Heterocephalus glaber TaxID=10181 RepID=G5BN48_HETGA|nr:Glucose-fructose oxidoreductase domain-containing protein 1 [Heterocephalus glaber]